MTNTRLRLAFVGNRSPRPLPERGEPPVPHPSTLIGHRGCHELPDDALAAEELLEKLNARRDELEALARADPIDGDAAVELIAELAELAKQIEAELTRARTLAETSEPNAAP